MFPVAEERGKATSARNGARPASEWAASLVREVHCLLPALQTLAFDPMVHPGPSTLTDRLLAFLGHEPTAGQRRASVALERLIASRKERATLVLKGYAGTGKSTLVGALVRTLSEEGHPVVLLAPTGRAAKVLSAYAGAPASTIHRRIYHLNADEEGYGGVRLAANKDAGALFVVDEASMIGRGNVDGSFGGRDLMEDLFAHAFSAPGCKLLLIGDPAQLPPVGDPHSPALDTKELSRCGLVAGVVELTEVVRQTEASGILHNATALRAMIPRPEDMAHRVNEATGKEPAQVPTFEPAPDVLRIEGPDLEDALVSAYDREGPDEVCVICRSNQRAYQYAQQVRARIYDFEEELCPGDRLMVVKNDHFWAARNGKEELIANGEPITVKRVHGTEERHGLHFADITASWWNGVEERELEVKVMRDVLAAPSASLPISQLRQMHQQVLSASEATARAARGRILREDPYANALQVKYAYAVTCHKAQGGQWKVVFVDQGYVTEEMIDAEYIRWLYTAVTRASEKLHLLNFHPRFWGEEDQ